MTRIIALIIFATAYITVFSQGNTLRFEQNKGQWQHDILYSASFTQGRAYIRQDRLTIVVLDSSNRYFHPHDFNAEGENREKYSVFSLQPYNAVFSEIVPKDMMNGYTNYFLGNDKSKWQSNVKSYQSVIYKNVYKNIDWEISSSDKMPKHTYIVHSGGETSNVKTFYRGVSDVRINGDKIIIKTFNGELQEDKLWVYQKTEKGLQTVEAEYQTEKTDEGFIVSYKIGNYDRNKDLIIDPDIVFATYSGSHSDNWGMTSAYDKKGWMISGGICHGSFYELTEGAYDITFNGNWDCVITKYDSLGQNMIFSTFLGGANGEMPHSMIVNKNDEIVVFGTTGSSDFPCSNGAFQTTFLGGEYINYENSISFPQGVDIFITTFNSTGTNLLYSTFIGGHKNDGLNFRQDYGTSSKVLYDGNDSLYANYGDCARGEIVTDDNNNVYIASCTFSNDFPTSASAFQPYSGGGQDAVVFKLDHSLSSLLYSTYLGGIDNDAAYSLDLDSENRAYVCGGTVSKNFPVTANAYKTTHQGGTTDAFVSVISDNGTSLEASTYFGSDKYDQAFFIRLSKDGFPFIYGQTKASGNTLIYNANYNIPNSGQFVTKLSGDLQNLEMSTVFGTGDGMINLSPSGFAVDICGRIYCAGWGRIFKYNKQTLGYTSLGTTSMEVTSDAYMSTTDGMDFYIMSMTMDASSLDYATFFGEYSTQAYYGNDHVDGGTSRFDRFGSYYLSICASCQGSQGIPTTAGAYSASNNSENCNMASVKFSIHNDFAVADFDIPAIYCANTPVTMDNVSRGDSFVWDFGDNTALSTEKNPSHVYVDGGEYTIMLIAHLESGCHADDTVYKKILILDNEADYLDTITTCVGKPVSIGFGNMALTDKDNYTFSWTPEEYLSDAHSINPYANVTASTLFRLIITGEDCLDTVYRYVNVYDLTSNIPDTLTFCTVPFVYSIDDPQQGEYICSYFPDFHTEEEMLNNNTAIAITDTVHKYLYIKYKDNGCMGKDSVWLNYNGVYADLIITDAGCNDGTAGSVKVVPVSGNEEYHYSWSFSDIDSDYADNIDPGDYSVKIFSKNNACSLELPFKILAIKDFNISADVKDATCENICDGSILISVSGGESPYTYEWINYKSDKNSVKDLCVGEYTVIVTDNTGCSNKKTMTVKDKGIAIELTATENKCENGCSASISSSVSGGKSPYEYQWNTGEHTQNIYDLCNGDYSVIVTDNTGCQSSKTINVTYTDAYKEFSAKADEYDVFDGQSVHLTADYIEGMTYSWTPSQYMTSADKYETDVTVYETTIYTVYATDNKGCDVSDTVMVKVEYVECDKPNIFIPNAFTPNDDGKNDVLYISGEHITSVDWIIYDRWGEKVFQSNDINAGWDGRFRNQPCAAGVYYYKLEVHCIGGKTFVTGGDVTLIR